MALRELMTDPPPRHPPRHMDAWLADHISLPPALERLLADLEAPSPSIQEFEVDLGGDEFGGLFKNIFASEGFFKVSGKVDLRRDEFGEAFKYSSHEAEKDARARVRLRVLRAIGNCPSLRTIILNPSGRIGVYSVTEAEAGAFLEALRQSNHVLEMLDLSGCGGFGSEAACVALAGLLRISRTLTTLDLWGVGLTSEGLCHIAKGLPASHACSLQELDVGTNSSIGKGTNSSIGKGGYGIPGAHGGAQYLAKIITHMPTLRSLDLYDIGMDMAGGQMIADALATNPSVEELSIGWEATNVVRANQSPALTRILRALTLSVTQVGGSGDDSSIQTPNVKTLGLVVVGDGSRHITAELGQALASMLRYNTCLQTLFISTCFIGHGLEALTYSTSISTLRLHSSFDSSTQDNPMKLTSIMFGCKQLQSLQFWGYFPEKVLTQVFRALKDNPSITSLLLDSCKGLDDTMFRDLMESLQLNTNLETISIKGTSWDREGKSAAINDSLKFNKRQVAYVTILYQHGNVQPANPTAGRLFLCGPGFAGKTTLRASMIRAWSNSKHPSFTTPELLDHLPSWVGPRRTQGIEIQMLRDDPTMQISIWDFAGQDKFRALQSYLFPTIAQPCVFFFVFNPYDSKTRTVKAPAELEKELQHWLRFIASNSNPDALVLPQIIVILTHLDRMPQDQNSEAAMTEWAAPVVTQAARRYSGLLNISSKILALKASSTSSVAPSLEILFCLFDEMFKKLKPVPEPCIRMHAVLIRWRLENPSLPIMSLSDFHDLCRENVKQLCDIAPDAASTILEAISSYLHDVGAIMYFKTLGFVIVDPDWVSHIFLGCLMQFNPQQPASSSFKSLLPTSLDGFVTQTPIETTLRRFMKKHKFQGFSHTHLLGLMLELKLCYEEAKPGGEGVKRYFIPHTLNDASGKAMHGLRQLEWLVGNDGSVRVHVGRRLQCKDQLRTYLDAGFFPRFQVVLRERLFETRPEMKPEQYRNQLNLIAFHTDGIEVLIEMPGDVEDFIDILVRSRKTPEQTRAFVVEHVLNEMRSFCASPEGSQGVELVEGIIRPECVSNLTLCVHRRDQAVLKSDLMGHLLREHVSDKGCGPIFTSLEDLDYHHTWNEVDGAGLRVHQERADGLLDPEDMFEVLNKRERSVQQQFIKVEEAAKVMLCDTQDSKGTGPVHSSDRQNTLFFGHTMSDLGLKHRTLLKFHRPHQDTQLDDMDAKIDKMGAKMDKMDAKLDVITSLQKEVLQKVQDIKSLQEQTLVAVSSSMDKIMNFSAELLNSEVPRRPYFTTDDVGTSQKLVAGIQMCKAMRLHFMCENPQGNHVVARQDGLALTVEIARWKWIRPIAAQSARMLVFLMKAGLHVAAGIGSAVPDFAEWAGAVPLTAAALAGESLLGNISSEFSELSSVEQSKRVEDAWVFLKEELKPQLVAGKMGQLFHLYKVQLKQDVEGMERRVAWLCKECLAKEKGKGTAHPL